jgi:hypothetical protein
MSRADKRHQMVLADAVKGYVSQKHDFVVVLVENPANMRIWVIVHTRQELAIHPRHAGGRILQTVAVKVFADR